MRKLRPKVQGPAHPWEKMRIVEEKNLKKEYWYKNKREMWKMKTILKNFRQQARSLIGETSKQAQLHKKQLLEKLTRYGILAKAEIGLDDVLELTIKEIMERRLQTVVFRKKLTNTVKEARQAIVHGKILIAGKKVTSPSKLITIEEEKQLRRLE